MKLVTRDDIERWAGTAFSKNEFPYLISRLVRATTLASTKVNIPSGSATYIGGWDGIVNCESETSYVPKGISLWEFGTGSKVKGKADKDYKKRKDNPMGFTPKDSVFIFVTPRLWKKKDDWIKEKKAENHWKDVIVYDSVDIEQWLDNAIYVSIWFADYLRKAPLNGVDIAEHFWKYWSEYTGIKLLPETIVSGREKEQKEVFDFLENKPSITYLKAASKNEAIAFIIAAAKLFSINESEKFFSKALVVHNEEAYKMVSTNFVSPLILIPTFENRLPMYSAVSNNHHVIVPLGADDDFNQGTITLPTIDRDGQINSLVKSGLTKDNAEKFSRESGRNITILKKLLGFPHNKAKWFKEDIREIIPALLLGRWNESFIGDIKLIEQLSNQKYDDYSITLNKWRNFEESPIIQIGETWRLTSPLDLWTNLSARLTKKDFKNLKKCFSRAFKKGNPIIEPKDKNDFVASFNKKRKYSNWSREGLTQSLILVGHLGDRIKIPNLRNPKIWVDSIIRDLLYNATGNTWVSVNSELPLISEASPDSFLKSVNHSLAKEEPEMLEMFEEKEDFLHKTSHHTGLLWALENLAWLPEYLMAASLILLKLSRLDPGGSLSNRPLNSITEIFKPWHYQTLASYDKRMEVLKYITEREREKGWSLLISMLPEHHGVAHPTHKMRWRMFDENTKLEYTYQEIEDTHSAVIEMLIELFDYDENKFAQLIDNITNLLSPKDRDRFLTWADEVCLKVEQKNFTTWATIRKILNDHRSHPDTDWVLPESELKRLEALYNKLQPPSTIEKYIWLFNDHFPRFPEGFTYKDSEYEKGDEQQQKRVDDARKDAVINFISELGLDKTLELRNEISELWAFGYALADVITKQEDILTISKCLYDEESKIFFIRGFIYRKSIENGFDWVKALFNNLQEKDYSHQALSNVLIPITQNQELWNSISALNEEIQNLYWQNVSPNFYHISDAEKVFGIEMLLTHKRFFSAIDIASHFPKVIPTNLLLEMLQKAGTEESSETTRFEGYKIGRIFKELDNKEHIKKSTIAKLEWIYLPILDSYGTTRNPINLEEELAVSPEFFIDVLKWIYLPKDETLLEEERKGITDEVVQSRARAKQSYHLLNSWKKIPGMKDDNSIDELELKNWIDKVRELAKNVSRLEVADMHIGRVLAQYPENIPEWPQETIFKIIEEINSDVINNNYLSALFNKRGYSSRGVFDGGDIERDNADCFEKLEKDFRNKYPNVSEIFKRLSKDYLLDAKQMDAAAERNRLEY